MANDSWETPDIAGMLDRRDENANRSTIHHQDMPLGVVPGGEFGSGPDQYVIDPDYMDMMNIQDPEQLIKYRR